MVGLDATMAVVRKLPPEMVSVRGGVVLAALRKAAKPMDARRRANLQAVTAHTVDADKRESTGFLAKNLTVSRGKAPFGGKGERLLLRVRRKAYPDRNGKTVTTLAAANLLEWGAPANNQPAEPWVRPAYLSTAQEVIQGFDRELKAAVERVVKKHARLTMAK